MPTLFDPQARGEWVARTDTPKRSVFGNYRASDAGAAKTNPPGESPKAGQIPLSLSLQAAIDLALARAFVYRFLAKAYEDPCHEVWAWLCAPETLQRMGVAWEVVAADEPLRLNFQPEGFSHFHDAYLAVFGHAARGTCPLNEIEYGDIKSDPLFQPHRLADLAAFYRAFGLELVEEAGERHDHLCLQLEFLCVLAAKEAYALEHQFDGEQLELCRDAQKKFLREHLGRWTPAFTRRLMTATNEPALGALCDLTRRFVERECKRFGVSPGSSELALRPVNEAADRMCESCGINSLPPGAAAATE